MKKLAIILALIITSLTSVAQDRSTGTLSRRTDRDRNKPKTETGITERMQAFFDKEPISDSEQQWMRIMYREVDLTKPANGALYFPEEPVDGQESLFRIIMRLLANDQIPAYEYLDGREVFDDQYRIKVRDMLDRFHIMFTDAKGSNEKHPKFTIEEADVPAQEVLSYYMIEKWEFDKRSNKMRSRIQALCPVLHRSGDFGGEALKYPMFWVKYDDLRPYLNTQNIFIDDDNNLATCTYDDYFQLGLYDGDIYKTRNLQNKSLMQMFPDPDDLKHAQDSIQNRLAKFEDKLWVPSLAELEQRRIKAEEAAEAAEMALNSTTEEGENTEVSATSENTTKRTVRSRRGSSSKEKSTKTKAKKTSKPKTPKAKKPKQTSSSATKSVRNRRR